MINLTNSKQGLIELICQYIEFRMEKSKYSIESSQFNFDSVNWKFNTFYLQMLQMAFAWLHMMCLIE